MVVGPFAVTLKRLDEVSSFQRNELEYSSLAWIKNEAGMPAVNGPRTATVQCLGLSTAGKTCTAKGLPFMGKASSVIRNEYTPLTVHDVLTLYTPKPVSEIATVQATGPLKREIENVEPPLLR